MNDPLPLNHCESGNLPDSEIRKSWCGVGAAEVCEKTSRTSSSSIAKYRSNAALVDDPTALFIRESHCQELFYWCALMILPALLDAP